jgi:hypothetical protein
VLWRWPSRAFFAEIESVAARVERLVGEYHQAKAGLDAAAAPFAG